MINQQELGELVGDNDNRTMPLGVSPLYNNYPISSGSIFNIDNTSILEIVNMIRLMLVKNF